MKGLQMKELRLPRETAARVIVARFLGATVIAALSATAWPAAAEDTPAAVPEAGPSAVFSEYATIVGIGDTLTLTRLPIRTAAGKTIYKDVTIELFGDAAGKISFAVSPPVQSVSPKFAVANIRAGTYALGSSVIAVTGPAPTGGGAARWTVTGTCYFAPSAFYTGAIATIPDAALKSRLAAAGITNKEYSYGVRGESCDSGAFRDNALLGVQQVDNTLVVASFTSAAGVDQSTPAQFFVFTLQP